MKIVVGSLLIAAFGAAAYAQNATPATAPAPPTAAGRVLAEFGAVSGRSGGFKNAPFSAEEVNESVQTLADGNRIIHSSTNKMYRNGEGRVRRDIKGGVIGGVPGSTYTLSGGATIVDPVINRQILLDTEAKVARIGELSPQALTVVRAQQEVERAAVERLQERIASTPMPAIKPVPSAPVVVSSGSGGTVFSYDTPRRPAYETRTEDLGTRDFDGVAAEGKRTTTIIPAGAIGNERPIETVYERWYSNDLGVVVYSKRSDPRTGESTYKLTNIVRAEPDPSLFNIPTEYKKISSTGPLFKPATAAAKAETVNVKAGPTSSVRNKP